MPKTPSDSKFEGVKSNPMTRDRGDHAHQTGPSSLSSSVGRMPQSWIGMLRSNIMPLERRRNYRACLLLYQSIRFSCPRLLSGYSVVRTPSSFVAQQDTINLALLARVLVFLFPFYPCLYPLSLFLHHSSTIFYWKLCFFFCFMRNKSVR